MTRATATRVSLLLRLRDTQDTNAWSQFTEIYGPLVFNFGRRSGMQEADAADLVQDVMGEVAKSIVKFEYDPRIGKFRSWLYKIAKRAAGRAWSKRQRQPQGSGDTAIVNTLNQIEDESVDGEWLWEKHYQTQLLTWAAEQIRDQFHPHTWQAFWRTAVEGQTPQEVAKQLALNVGSIYVAKNRVMKRLAAKILEIDDTV